MKTEYLLKPIPDLAGSRSIILLLEKITSGDPSGFYGSFRPIGLIIIEGDEVHIFSLDIMSDKIFEKMDAFKRLLKVECINGVEI